MKNISQLDRQRLIKQAMNALDRAEAIMAATFAKIEEKRSKVA